jgi:hypothetical protein
MKHSESIANLAAALARAQGKMNAAMLNAVNPFLKNRYADLGAVIEAARPFLAENDLSFSQFATVEQNRVNVETLLMHGSGEWLSETLSLPLGDNKGLSAAQAVGVVITYARRYALAPMLGVYAGDDADGNDNEPTNGGTTAAHSAPIPQAVAIPAMNLKAGGVAIPSKRAATNGNAGTQAAAKRATIKTAHFGEITEWAVKQGYVEPDNSAPFRLTQVAANYGYAEITDANMADVRGVIQDYYEAKKAIEQQDAEAAAPQVENERQPA